MTNSRAVIHLVAFVVLAPLPGCIVTSSARAYEPCNTSDDCNSLSDRCLALSENEGALRVCTRECTAAEDCTEASDTGGTAACAELAIGPYCVATCTEDADCAEGFECVALEDRFVCTAE